MLMLTIESTMDVSTLHTLTDDLAGYLSEVTQSDLGRLTPEYSGDLGELYLHLLEQNLDVAAAVAGQAVSREDRPDREALDAAVDLYGGCGLESGYRATACIMEDAFAAATDVRRRRQVKGFKGGIDVVTLYDSQISNTVIRTWDVAEVLGLPYRPEPAVTQKVLQTFALEKLPHDADIFDCVLALSGRKTVA